MARNVKTPVHVSAFRDHILLNLSVMGCTNAWSRVATPDEVGRTCALLADTLAAGAIGLACNRLDCNEHDRPLPSPRTDAAEY